MNTTIVINMTRTVVIVTIAATWLLMVAKPVGSVVEAWLLDVVVYGLPPVPPGDEEAPSDEAPAMFERGEDA